jgi:signal peptidase I
MRPRPTLPRPSGASAVVADPPDVTDFAPPQPKQKSFLRDLLEIVLLALVIYFVIMFLVQTVHVMGQSMEPTLNHNDFLIASKISYHLHAPERGDIVVFRPSTDPSHDYIKRVIGVPGDHLRISHAQIFINGHPLKESYLNEQWVWSDTWNNGTEDLVPADSYFLMGDNRNHSTDSRFLGYQKKDQFLGKAWVRVWPLSDVRIFTSGIAYAN